MSCGSVVPDVKNINEENGVASVPETLDATIRAIQIYLANEYGCDDWKDFIDNQSMGDCQGIAGEVERMFGLKEVFGNFELDQPIYFPEDDEFGTSMTHHWNVDSNGNIYDFSKGTLRNLVPEYTGMAIYAAPGEVCQERYS